MSVIAKFKVESVRDSNSIRTVQLGPVIDGSEENKQFWQYTPAGQIILSTTNRQAADYFEIGKEYYIDFTKA